MLWFARILPSVAVPLLKSRSSIGFFATIPMSVKWVQGSKQLANHFQTYLVFKNPINSWPNTSPSGCDPFAYLLARRFVLVWILFSQAPRHFKLVQSHTTLVFYFVSRKMQISFRLAKTPKPWPSVENRFVSVRWCWRERSVRGDTDFIRSRIWSSIDLKCFLLQPKQDQTIFDRKDTKAFDWFKIFT